jgi:hypothetical protein
MYKQAQDAPHALGGSLGKQFQWNYDHLAELWAHEKWLPETAVQLAKAHYSAYMVRRQDGLRIITVGWGGRLEAENADATVFIAQRRYVVQGELLQLYQHDELG